MRVIEIFRLFLVPFELFYASFIFPFLFKKAIKRAKKEAEDNNLCLQRAYGRQNGGEYPDNYYDPNNKEFGVANQLWTEIKEYKAKIETTSGEEKKKYIRLRRDANEKLIGEVSWLKKIGFRWIRPG